MYAILVRVQTEEFVFGHTRLRASPWMVVWLVRVVNRSKVSRE